ncbi:hypothetical protein MMPV_006045 [Pyropia vietnamensis]
MVRGGGGGGGDGLMTPLPILPTPLTAAITSAMPEYALLGRCARARSWLADAWDPAAEPVPVPPLEPAALASAVAHDRVLRFPAAAAATASAAASGAATAAGGGPAAEPDSYLPPDEADGTGLGPVLADLTAMSIPVEAPPLRRTWTATVGGGAAPVTEQSGEVPTTVEAPVEADASAYDEDDEVVTVFFVFDVQRDLIRVTTNDLVSIQPTARGVMHRRTGEAMLLMSVAAPPGLPVARLLMLDYYAPLADGGGTHIMTSLGVSGNGSLTLLNRMDAVMTPSTPRPAPFFPPVDGVTAIASLTRSMYGAYGLAYAPAVPVGSAGAAASPQLLPLVLQCTPASAATTARMRCRAVAALVPPAGPPRLLGAGDTERARAKPQVGARRSRRLRLDLEGVSSEAVRRRIVRNRASAARSNAARRQVRLDAQARANADVAHEAAGGEPRLVPAVFPRPPMLLPRWADAANQVAPPHGAAVVGCGALCGEAGMGTFTAGLGGSQGGRIRDSAPGGIGGGPLPP